MLSSLGNCAVKKGIMVTYVRTYSIQFDVAMCLINCHSIDVVTVPPAHLQRQLNVDNIQMQPSPAYVSIDKKSPQLYQNI